MQKDYEALHERLKPYLDELREHARSTKEKIRKIAFILEESNYPVEWICQFLKWLFEQEQINLSDDTIENSLPEKYKESKKRRKTAEGKNLIEEYYGQPSNRTEQRIEVSSSGSQSYTKADGTEGEREDEEQDDDVPPEKDDPLFYEGEPDIPLIDISTELGVTEIIALKQEKDDLELRLNEALKLADDKDKALERERIQNANLEVELGEAKKNEAAALSKPANHRGPTMEELQIKYDELRAEYAELLEVERLRTSKSDFKSAATLPKQCYVYAVDAINFFVPLKKAKDWAMDHSDPWKKILFDVGPDGQLKATKFDSGHSNEYNEYKS